MILYLFNPSTDMALAAGSVSYTPPAAIRRFEAGLALLPALYAQEGSAILLPYGIADPSALPYRSIAGKRHISLIGAGTRLTQVSKVVPWGWNAALVRTLRSQGVPDSCLPGDLQLARLRALSSRLLTTDCHAYLSARLSGKCLDRYCSLPPIAARTMSEIQAALDMYVDCFAKAPWSSSGKGVMRIGHPLPDTDRRRLERILRTQGAVMMEKAWDNAQDFATEWMMQGGDVRFLGLSVFGCDTAGRYKGNIVAPQSGLRRRLASMTDLGAIDRLTAAQHEFLKKRVAPWYDGPAGIDMLVDQDGEINGCVEINLRHTMGYVALHIARHAPGCTMFEPGAPLYDDKDGFAGVTEN